MLVAIKKPILPENWKRVESHLEAALLHHTKAAKLLNEGEYIGAARNTVIAQKYISLANKAMRGEILKAGEETPLPDSTN